MRYILLGEFVIDQDLTLIFSRASGDFNPLHTNPIIARRYQFGSTVVHGVCATLKALDLYIGSRSESVSLTSIKASYIKPIRHGEKVEVFVSNLNSSDVKLKLVCQGSRCQQIQFRLKIRTSKHLHLYPKKYAINEKHPFCSDILFEESQDKIGAVPLVWDEELTAELFPSLKRCLPDYQVCLILGTTNIVGMHCPGLNSVYGSFRLSFVEEALSFEQSLRYEVSHSDHRFMKSLISLIHPAVQGELEVFFRARPVVQCGFDEIKSLVQPNQFVEQTALIIGGSRGLGEITGKLISAGKGHVFLTYASGKSDAEAVVNDIKAGGGHCESLYYDVLTPVNNHFKFLENQKITHIYYFASPQIEKSGTKIWNELLFRKYTDFYLTGLARLLEYFVSNSDYHCSRTDVFAPSTEFINEPIKGYSEYIASKAAMELFAEQLENKYSGWRFSTPRLPRLLTDQTSSVLQESPTKAVETILAQLAKLYY